jgi:hypothetical protein
MPWGGHACNVTDADTFNTILRREQEAGTSRSSAALIISVGQAMAAARREKSACFRARLPRLEAEDALAISHFQGKENLLKRLQALKQADRLQHAGAGGRDQQIVSGADNQRRAGDGRRATRKRQPARGNAMGRPCL